MKKRGNRYEITQHELSELLGLQGEVITEIVVGDIIKINTVSK